MGSQQILLIVLSVILVGIAVAVGLAIFKNQAQQSEIDELVNTLVQASKVGYEYYMKPQFLNGASRSMAVTVENSDRWMQELDSSVYNASGPLEIGNNGEASFYITAQTPSANRTITVTTSTDGTTSVNIVENN